MNLAERIDNALMGCGSSICNVNRRAGQHNNGGCRCLNKFLELLKDCQASTHQAWLSILPEILEEASAIIAGDKPVRYPIIDELHGFAAQYRDMLQAPSATEAAVPAELLRNVLLVMETCLSCEEGSLADVVIERVRAEVKKLPPLMLAAASPAKQPEGEV